VETHANWLETILSNQGQIVFPTTMMCPRSTLSPQRIPP
jgi:hypothetical protein